MTMLKLFRPLRHEKGFALPMALGVSIALAATVATVIELTSSNSRWSSYSKANVSAYALAEAGMNNARSVLWHSLNPRDPTSVPTTTLNLDGGTAVFSGSYNDTTSTWTLTSTGTVNNPNGTVNRAVTRTIKSKVRVSTAEVGGANDAIWNYLYSDVPPGGGCMTLSNNSAISTPFYVRGDLCMGNNSSVSGGATMVLQVGGTLTLNNGATVGTAANKVNQVKVGGGCTGGNPNPHACTAADRVYATNYSSSTSGLVKPPIDLASWYQYSYPGPKHNCTTGSFPGGFDNDSVQNNSLPAVNLTPASGYDCRVSDDMGNIIGRITWVPGNPKGTLTVYGTMFFDGPISYSGSAIYQGRATIYSSGTITFANSSSLCGVSACDTSWDSTSNLLVLVAGSNAQNPSCAFTLSNNAVFQGATMMNGDYCENNNSGTWGAVIAHQLYISNNAINHYVPFGTILPGQPSTGGIATTLVNEGDSYVAN
jgi:Tfp pilus assembly protein PilX